tara:strand:- start:747 stop:1523 length:777 start_codon:yes stop_codon:yes gene_type:complete
MSKTKETKAPHPEDGWEIKNRTYFLTGNKEPLTLTLKSRHTEKYPLLYFDPVLKTQRALRYATNQNSCFVDEQKGESTLAHIMFKDGTLSVPKEYQALQKMLSLYHPDVNKRFSEYKPVQIAQDELVDLEIQLIAMNAARDMDIDTAEAIMRVEVGSRVTDMSSKELKRDLMIFSKNNPKLFIDLAQDDNVQLRNFGIKAIEANIIKLSQDQRYFTWGTTDRKLVTVPFDENPYSALAAWFKTDEGVEVFKTIEKKLS